MKKLSKILAVVLALALTAGLSVSLTVAYLSDTDEQVNTMTLGNVYIDQLEYERVQDANGDFVMGEDGVDFDADYGINASYKLQEFTQDKPAYPAVYNGDGTGTESWADQQQLWNGIESQEGIGAPGSNDIFGDDVANVIDKFVFVENTGANELYFRTLVAVEAPASIDYENLIHVNLSSNNRYQWTSSQPDGMTMGVTEINGVNYIIFEAVHTEPLQPGNISRPSFLQAYLDPAATNDDCAAFGDKWEILTISQAVQTAGFDNAQVALDAAFGDVTLDSAADLFEDLLARQTNP